MAEPLFRAAQHQQHLDALGYARLPFLDAPALEALRQLYQEQLAHDDNTGFRVTLDLDDPALIRQFCEGIMAIMQPAVERVFQKVQVFTASFTAKAPGAHFTVPPHQDWTFTDENHHRSLTVWVPLQPVEAHNGALGVIDGSHRLLHHPRSSPSPQSRSPLTDHMALLMPYLKVQPMDAGEALVFDNRTIHGSPPNQSDAPRVAAGIGIMSEAAPLRHYYQLPGTGPEQLAVYRVEREFYYTYNNTRLAALYTAGQQPEDWPVESVIPRNAPHLTSGEMKSLIESVPSNTLPEPEPAPTPAPKPTAPAEPWKDPRTFWQTYTLPNMWAELKWRWQQWRS